MSLLHLSLGLSNHSFDLSCGHVDFDGVPRLCDVLPGGTSNDLVFISTTMIAAETLVFQLGDIPYWWQSPLGLLVTVDIVSAKEDRYSCQDRWGPEQYAAFAVVAIFWSST